MMYTYYTRQNLHPLLKVLYLQKYMCLHSSTERKILITLYRQAKTVSHD